MIEEPRINYTEENIHERLSTIEDSDLKYSYSENYGNPVIHELTLENSGHGSGLLVEDVLTIKETSFRNPEPEPFVPHLSW